MRRNWIKLYVDQVLRGTCFKELIPDERFIWFGFLLLAGDNAMEGKICVTEEAGFSNEQLASLLKCETELINRSIKKMIKHEKIKLDKNNIIQILNWKRYQSEYQRQKPHREPAFIKLRDTVKERDNYTCLECNKSEKELKVPLCIHHIDNDPKNNNLDNLITLCMSCHSGLLKKKESATEKCNKKVQQKSAIKKFDVKCNIDIEEERDKDKDNNNTYSRKDNSLTDKFYKEGKKEELKTQVKEIVNYLNEKSKKNFRPTTVRTISLIKARLNEKFNIDDFKKVIDVKTKQWLKNKEFEGFLRPETLFGNKFEGYLNEHKDKKPKRKRKFFKAEDDKDKFIPIPKGFVKGIKQDLKKIKDKKKMFNG